MNDQGFESINVIPLVDVMLVLLTIVLTTSTFIAVGTIPVQLPQASVAAEERKQNVTVAIDKDGTIFFDNRPESLNSLRDKLATRERDLAVVVRADRTIALQLFVDVMEVIKGLGFQRISLQTENRG